MNRRKKKSAPPPSCSGSQTETLRLANSLRFGLMLAGNGAGVLDLEVAQAAAAWRRR
jgi:hypothetical protein